MGRIWGATQAVDDHYFFFSSLIVTLLLMLQILPVSAYPRTIISSVSPLRSRAIPQSPAPEYNFPGSITICRQDYYEDCTTLVEAPASVQRRCTQVPDGFDERVSSFEVKGGCCEFFPSNGCAGQRLLIGCNERKATLFGSMNNRISSWKCYFGDKWTPWNLMFFFFFSFFLSLVFYKSWRSGSWLGGNPLREGQIFRRVYMLFLRSILTKRKKKKN